MCCSRNRNLRKVLAIITVVLTLPSFHPSCPLMHFITLVFVRSPPSFEISNRARTTWQSARKHKNWEMTTETMQTRHYKSKTRNETCRNAKKWNFLSLITSRKSFPMPFKTLPDTFYESQKLPGRFPATCMHAVNRQPLFTARGTRRAFSFALHVSSSISRVWRWSNDS